MQIKLSAPMRRILLCALSGKVFGDVTLIRRSDDVSFPEPVAGMAILDTITGSTVEVLEVRSYAVGALRVDREIELKPGGTMHWPEWVQAWALGRFSRQ